MSKTLTSHIDKKNIFDIFVDFFIFIHFHYENASFIIVSAEMEYISSEWVIVV
jgi:hypothetical protein